MVDSYEAFKCGCTELPNPNLKVATLLVQSHSLGHTCLFAIVSKVSRHSVLNYVVQSHRIADSMYRYRAYPGFRFIQAACRNAPSLWHLLRHKRWVSRPFWLLANGELREYQFQLAFDAASDLPDQVSTNLLEKVDFTPLRR